MTRTLACGEVGLFPECDGVISADTDDEVMRQAAEHGRSVHGMTEEQLSDPETQRTIGSYIREG